MIQFAQKRLQILLMLLSVYTKTINEPAKSRPFLNCDLLKAGVQILDHHIGIASFAKYVGEIFYAPVQFLKVFGIAGGLVGIQSGTQAPRGDAHFVYRLDILMLNNLIIPLQHLFAARLQEMTTRNCKWFTCLLFFRACYIKVINLRTDLHTILATIGALNTSLHVREPCRAIVCRRKQYSLANTMLTYADLFKV